MDAILRQWMQGLDPLPTIDDASASVARTLARAAAAEAGLDLEASESAALVASELVNNQLTHARSGQLAVRAVALCGVRGIEIVAADRGRGVGDPTRALSGSGPSARSLGVGLATVRAAAHELDLDVRVGEGTCVRARIYASRPARRREVAILGRPCEGEALSGDGAAFVRTPEGLLLALADGLGHGPLARDASVAALDALLDAPERSLPALLEGSAAALVRTRGAVMTVVRIDEGSGRLEHAAVGNVIARVERRGGSQSFAGSAFVLGAPGTSRRPIRVERAEIGPSDALILFSDGLGSRTSIDDPDLLREPAVTIAQHLLERFGRANDDAMILVAK